MKNGTLTACALAVALLAGCSTPGGLTPSQMVRAFDGPRAVAKIPSCKGQKTTKDYAGLGAKPLSTKGGTLCVPLFRGWGGSMTYPGPTTSGVTMTLTSSTTAYSGASWPPSPPGTAIFYLQYALNKNGVDFGSSISGTGDVASKMLKAKAQYTIFAEQEASPSLWLGLAECYVTAVVGKYGPELPGIGKAAFAGHNLFYAGGVIEIIPGDAGGAAKC